MSERRAAQPQDSQQEPILPARRRIQDDQLVHLCVGCNHILGTEPLPPLGKQCEGEPLLIKCQCNALNLVLVGRARSGPSGY